MVIIWLDFREIPLETFILPNFLEKFRMCCFKVKHYFGHISGLVGPIDVKQKGSALVGYWVQYVTLTLELIHYLDLGCFKVKYRNSSISGIVGLIDLKWKRKWVNMILDRLYDLALWPHPWPWLWSWNLKSESEITLSQEWVGRLTWNEKDVSHPFMTMILTSVTMVGWADVPNSDWVTSEVGVPSTYLVIEKLNSSGFHNY